MPIDAQAVREGARLGNEGGDTRVNLAARYDEAQQNIGFGTGAGNPYSEAAQLKAQHVANTRGIRNTAGNQLYAGSTLNKMSAERSQFDAGQKRLEDTAARATAAYNRGVARSRRDEQMGRYDIQEGAINRAVSAGPTPMAVPRGRGRPRRRPRQIRGPAGAGGAYARSTRTRRI